MFRKKLARYLPRVSSIQSLNLHRVFGKRINDSRIWSINRTSVSRATAIGLFCAYMPFPMQMIPAAVLSIFLHANLPVAVALVWISNPLTFIFVFTPPYLLGLSLVGGNNLPLDQLDMTSLFSQIKPLLVGSLIFGTGLAISGYVLVQVVWRAAVLNRWRSRRGKQKNPNPDN